MQVHGQMERQELEEVIQAIKASGAIKQAFAVCEYYIKRAEEMINKLPAHPVNSLFTRDITVYRQARSLESSCKCLQE